MRDDYKVKSRAEGLPEETGSTAPDDPEAQAERILTESEDRTNDPSTVDPTDDGVERRRTDDLLPDEHVRPDVDVGPA